MARVYETQVIEIDWHDASPITNVNLDKNFSVLEVAVITNTITPNAHRIVTLGIVYDDAVVSQHSLSVFPYKVGQNLADAVNVPINDVQTVQFTEFVDFAIKDDEFFSTIITLSTVGAQVNQYSTQKVQLDPSNPITVGVPVAALGTLLESRIHNVGSLQHTTQSPSRGQGTINAVEVIVSQA